MQQRNNNAPTTTTFLSSFNSDTAKKNDPVAARLVAFSSGLSSSSQLMPEVRHRYVPLPTIESDRLFESGLVVFKVVALFLQHLLIYKSEKWIGPYRSSTIGRRPMLSFTGSTSIATWWAFYSSFVLLSNRNYLFFASPSILSLWSTHFGATRGNMSSPLPIPWFVRYWSININRMPINRQHRLHQTHYRDIGVPLAPKIFVTKPIVFGLSSINAFDWFSSLRFSLRITFVLFHWLSVIRITFILTLFRSFNTVAFSFSAWQCSTSLITFPWNCSLFSIEMANISAPGNVSRLLTHRPL